MVFYTKMKLKQRSIYLFLTLAVSLAALIVTVQLSDRSQDIRERAASADDPTISLTASSGSVQFGQNVDISVVITNTAAKRIVGTDVSINFDRTRLILTGITPVTTHNLKTFVPLNANNVFDGSSSSSIVTSANSTGTLIFGAVAYNQSNNTVLSPQTASFTLATLHFTAKSLSGPANLSFNAIANSTIDTNIVVENVSTDSLRSATGIGVILVAPPTITFTPTPTLSSSCPSLISPGDAVAIYSNPTFIWSACLGTNVKYNLKITTGTQSVYSVSITQTSYTITNQIPWVNNTVYSWTVKVCPNADCVGGFPSPARTFTYNPTPTNTPIPTSTSTPTPIPPTATRIPTPTCVPVPPPTNLQPQGTITPGLRYISWNMSTPGSRYLLRVNDIADGWTCYPATGNDVCTGEHNNVNYQYNFLVGHTYDIWVHSTDCGYISPIVSTRVTVAAPTATPTRTPTPIPPTATPTRTPTPILPTLTRTPTTIPTNTVIPTATRTPTPTSFPCSAGAQGNLDSSLNACIDTGDFELFRQAFGKQVSSLNTPAGQHTPNLLQDSSLIIDTGDYGVFSLNFGICQ